MKIFVDGKDNLGWAIDALRFDLQQGLKRLGIVETKVYLRADIVHNVWWRTILSRKNILLRIKRNLLLTATNFIDFNSNDLELHTEFEKANKFAKAWIVPSHKQKKHFEAFSIRTYYQPWYVDFSLFKPLREFITKEELSTYLGISPELLSKKVLIGSFQRDSLGNDLSKPKWQKGPELLIDLLKGIPRDKYLLILAGPRRHYVINQCKLHNIPYYYLGKETNNDDLLINAVSLQIMPYLYALVDIYIVSSASEGAPKAVLEATATKTLIFSTDVGLAPDFLQNKYIFDSKDKYKKALHRVVLNFRELNQEIAIDVETQYQTCKSILNYKTMDCRLLQIYKDILASK